MRKTKLFIVLLLISSSLLIGADQDCCTNGPLVKPFSLTIRAGVAPSIFSDRGTVNAVVCPFTTPFFQVSEGQKFGQVWHNYPLNIGIDLAFALANNVELFGEFNYRRASPTNQSFTGVSPAGAFGEIFLNLNHFQEFGGYVGFRYFFNRVFCDRCAFFLGSKFGLVNYTEVKSQPVRIVRAIDGAELTQDSIWYESNNAVSGGLQVGFDYLFCDSISLFFNAEIVASAAPKPLFNFAVENLAIFTNFNNLIRESQGTLLSFPVNTGFRFYFG
ncbi:hypothetical protein HYX58_00425 [Candidatus Dependentiae bacterium]|nr:hypothetical protein [Candidatus Dependentiae bacterium]